MAKQTKPVQPDTKAHSQAIKELKEIAPAYLENNKGYAPIDWQRWEEAQKAEREQHKMGYAEGIVHYAESYNQYFKHVQLGKDLHGLHVIEIGPADFPALYFCENYNGVIVEPMPSDHLRTICENKGIRLIVEPFEVSEIVLEPAQTVEVWLFNVMQHVQDPDVFIARCKMLADRIRFFEPINQPITTYHPHTFTKEDFEKWFPGTVQDYKGGFIPGFHEADCVYGCWIQ